jgi:hypothetical protein
MENANDKQLSFPQRNWFILCVIVAILSPIVVHLVASGARSEAYKQSTEVRAADTATASPNGATGPGGTTGSTGTGGAAGSDTSYKVAAPPGGANTTNTTNAANAANKAKPAAK